MKLDQVRRRALALEGTTEEPHFQNIAFRVKDKIFAIATPNGAYLQVVVSDAQRRNALAQNFTGVRWDDCGLRVLLTIARSRIVHDLLAIAWESSGGTTAKMQRITERRERHFSELERIYSHKDSPKSWTGFPAINVRSLDPPPFL